MEEQGRRRLPKKGKDIFAEEKRREMIRSKIQKKEIHTLK